MILDPGGHSLFRCCRIYSAQSFGTNHLDIYEYLVCTFLDIKLFHLLEVGFKFGFILKIDRTLWLLLDLLLRLLLLLRSLLNDGSSPTTPNLILQLGDSLLPLLLVLPQVDHL